MAERFDPYYTWLGIPPEEQPPDHYRLLGVRRFETNDDAIANAADQRMAYVRTFQTGKRSKESQSLLNEIAAARGVLLDPQRRPAYDDQLRRRLAAAGSSAVVPLDDLPAAVPVAQSLDLPAGGYPGPHATLPPPMAAGGQWSAASAAPAGVPVVHVPQPAVPVATSGGAAPVGALRSSTRPRRRGPSLATAIVIGGGSFAIGLVTLIATLIWAATR